MGFGRVIARAGVAGGAAVVYGRWLRPRLTDWGATHEEVAGPYPGRELVPDGERSGAMAVTIDAPPEQVWPWLVQVGWARGGWYSWDHLDNAGRPSAREIHPEWQDTAVGDQLRYWVPGVGPMDAYSVAVLEPHRFLGLHGLSDLRGRTLDPEQPRPSAYLEGLWGFLLEELPGGRTRLVVSGYQAARPRWLGRLLFYWLFPPVVWIMQARMLSVLKRNVERAAGTGTERVPAPRTPQVEAGADEPPVGAQPAVSRARTSSGQGAARPSESQT
jgi:proline iminopeptidase